MIDLKQFVDGHPAFFIEEGASLEDLLVEKAASDVAKEQEKFFDPSEAALPSVMEHFRRQLEQEGFVVTEGVLRRTLPTDVGLLHAESELMRLFNRYNGCVERSPGISKAVVHALYERFIAIINHVSFSIGNPRLLAISGGTGLAKKNSSNVAPPLTHSWPLCHVST